MQLRRRRSRSAIAMRPYNASARPAIARYLRSGETDPTYEAWSGDVIERTRQGHDELCRRRVKTLWLSRGKPTMAALPVSIAACTHFPRRDAGGLRQDASPEGASKTPAEED